MVDQFCALCLVLPVIFSASAQNLQNSARVDSLIGEFQKGESCMQGFRRLGYKATLNECILAAEEAKIRILWYKPDLEKPPIIIVPVQEGEPFAVIFEEGKQPIVKLYERIPGNRPDLESK